MKTKFISIPTLVLGVMIAAASCGNKSNQPEETTENDSIVIIEELPDKKDYTIYSYEQRGEITTDAKNELAKMKRRLEELKTEYATVKENYEAAIQELEQTHTAFNEKFKAFGEAKPETWESAKRELTAAYGEVAKNLTAISERVNNAAKKKEVKSEE